MKSKKLLSIILALAMMFSVLPASTVLVYADEITETISADTTWNDGDTVGGVTISGGTVTINGDVGITAAITIKGDVTFTGGGTLNRMSTSGNLIKVESGSLTLGNVTIDGNDVIISDSGAAAAINMAGGTVIMNDGAKITNHKRTSGYGPAVYMTGGNFKMKGGTISGCESRNYGGAIYLDGGSFEMNGGIIENNKTTLSSAGYGGGAFYVRAATLIIDDGLIQNNSSNSGGAIYNTSFGTTIINGGVIKGNAAVGDSPSGSAIFHSCKTTGEATLQIGGNANINVGNDIYLMSNTSATKYVEITSSIKNPLILTIEGESEGRVIADAADGVVLTYNDMAKIRLSNSSYALKLENNQIKLTQTSSGETKFPVYLGYDANNGTNAPDGSSAEIVAGNSATFTISDSVPTRTGYNFLGWATNKDATSAEYSSGGSITISSNTTLYAVWKKISTFETNEFTQPLAITDWTYGETANTPTAEAKYGTPKYTYSTAADGKYNDIVPTDAGTYYVKATVEETDKYTGLESDAVEFVIGKKTLTNDNITDIADQTYTGGEIKPTIEVKDGDKTLVLDTDYTVTYDNNTDASDEAKVTVEIISNNYAGTLEKTFTILPKTINSAITLTAPVKNEVPQTEIETDEYTATVVWSPEVEDKFGYDTVYTAKITITPKTNYTVKGIAENGYTVNGAETVTNEADSVTVKVVYPATENKNSNEFTQPLTITGWTYGETANTPTAEAKYGTIKYTYSNTADGTYTEKVPTNAGTHYVKATVEETADYSGLESDAFEFVIEKKTLTNDNITDIADQTYTGGEIKPAIEVKDGDKTLVLDTDYTVTYDNNTNASDEAKVTVEIISNNYAGTLEKTFTILPKTINTAITQLTAPVKNEVPQTEIETDEYTATVVWSPEVEDKFGYDTVYTAKITITPKTNYTVKGIAENGYTVSGAETVTNEADSATVTAVYSATGIDDTVDTNEFTKPLEIVGWTYGDTPNAPTASVKYGTPKYTYSTAADGEYNDIVPTDAGTYYVKAKVEETDKYTGLESDAVEFVIGKKILTNDNITKIADQTYTGEEIKPVIEVKDGDKILVLDTDYTVAYEKNIKASEEAKAKVEMISNNYKGTLEKLFTILPKTINSAIILTAPVKNEVPQTEIETDEYTATVAWSPEVTDKFGYSTVYTATITITPKANYTVKGIAENGYTVSGAQTVTNEADSATITAVYAATGSKSSGGSGRTKRYTVSFNTNGGNKITSQTVAKDNSAKEPTAPIKENFEFAGWYTDKELTTKYDFTEKVTKSFTLYAKWTEQKQENGGSEDVVNNNSGNENKESSNTIVLTIDEHDALVYGTTKTNDVAPKVVNDRTMLPARFIAENLGATVEWDGEKQLVTITGKNEKQEDVTILITIGSDYAKVNGEDVKLDSPAFVENDRTYTPIRFISENLGATVEWNETEQTVTIQRVK
ncbi:repeat [uncultured Clostridium sp.]|nr:repeat [uncultured Clostridium sp.]